MEPIPTAVAWPCDQTSLTGAIDAARQGLITPILVGPAAKIAELAKTHGIDLHDVEVIDVGESHAAAAKATQLVREGKAELLMKASLHSDEILGAVARSASRRSTASAWGTWRCRYCHNPDTWTLVTMSGHDASHLAWPWQGAPPMDGTDAHVGEA